MALTARQLQIIQEIIARHHQAYLVNWVSPKSVPTDVLAELKRRGMVDPQATTIEQSYALGQAIARANAPEARNMSFAAFKRAVAQNPLPLTPAENQAVEMAQQRAAINIVGLGNKINAQTGQMLIEQDAALRVKLRDTIKEKTVEAVEQRKSPQQLKSDLGWALEDWTRDLNRIAMTEKHSAMETGKADHIAALDGKDAEVAVMASNDACPHCLRLTTGSDGHPRILKLSELEANGTNVGRKVADWRLCVPVLHPNCCVPGTPILTAKGEMPVEEIRPGDVVLTHLGRWRVVTHLWLSPFEGVMRRLEVGQRTLQVTPNHALWTGSKWLQSSLCTKGQDVRKYAGEVRPAVGVDRETQNGPTGVNDTLLPGRILFGFGREGVPVTAIEFDGKLYCREGDIYDADIANHKTDLGQKSDVEQVGVHAALSGRAEFAGPKLSALNDRCSAIRIASSSFVGSEGVGLTFFKAETPHSVGLSLGHGPYSDASADQPTADSGAADFKLAGYSLLRQAFINVQVNDDRSVYIAPRLANDSFSRAHAADLPLSPGTVNATSSPFYSGPVYNLTVDEDHSYVAAGVAVKNCQCNLIRVPAGWGFDEHGELVPDGPLGTRTDADRLNRGGPEALDLYKAVRDGGHAAFAGLHIQVTRPKGSATGWAYGQFAAGPHLHKCLVGAARQSPAAYVVHTAGPDRLLVGFSTLERALAADTESRLLQRGLAAPTGASEVPTAALAAWASRTPARPTMELRRGFDGASYVDDVQDLDGTDALNAGTLLGEGSHGVNFEFDVPVKKRPRGANSDPTGLLQFVKNPQASVVVNPVRRTKADYIIQANLPKRGVHIKRPANTPLAPEQRKVDAKIARDGLEHQLAARYGGWVGQDAKFVIQDLAGILKQRETGHPPKRAPVKSKTQDKVRGG